MATAGGKVILLGEHAVVYGIPAIAAGLKQGATATAAPSKRDELWLGDRSLTPHEDRDEARAFAALLNALQVHGVCVHAGLNLPTGMGLGASAALGVAIARAVLDYRDLSFPGASQPADQRATALLNAALEWERVFHGNPSGIDTAAAIHGGCFRFSRAGGVKPLAVKTPLRLAIALCGQPASTKQMVEQVALLRERKPEVVSKTLAGIESVVENAVLSIEAGDLQALGKLFDLNQILLAGLFLSTTEIETACTLAREAGALGAKLTGSGGGGAVVALTLESSRERVLSAWRQHNIECFTTDIPAAALQGSRQTP